MLVRLGKDNDGWALKIRGIAPMIMQGWRTNGWVRAAPEVCGDDALRRKLIRAALDFNRALPKEIVCLAVDDPPRQLRHRIGLWRPARSGSGQISRLPMP